jgi:seryl-tRNA synthetase
MFLSGSGIFDAGVYASFDADGAAAFEALDESVLALFSDRAVERYAIPALISGEVLERCGYFHSFPDQIMALGTIAPEHCRAVAETGEAAPEAFAPCGAYLTPAACLHIYPMLGDRPPKAENTITTRARVYRHERQVEPPLTRLWDYTVREFVFVGSADFVQASLETAKGRALALAQHHLSEPALKRATDNFYPTKMNTAKKRLQGGNARKTELVAWLDKGPLAVASFNFHGFHFSGAFGFDAARSVVTGCAGFGLERWVAAMRLTREGKA